MHYFIYKHNINNKSYIGYTCKAVDKRLNEHILSAESTSNCHFHNAIRKYGKDNIQTEILEEGVMGNLLDIYNREIFWVAKYDSYANGYNMTKGGGGGDTLSNHPNKAEISKKLSIAGTGRYHTAESKKKMSNHAYTRAPMLEETKRKIGEANKGKTHSDETKKKLSALGKKKVFDDKYRKKLSETAKLRPKVTCPHCGKEGVYNVMQRWHFDKCKRRTI